MQSPRIVVNTSTEAAPRLSRRDCLGWATAGLAAPLLQACGGGSSGASASSVAAAQASLDPESVRWCRETIQATLSRSDIATTAVSVALLADDRVVWREAFGHANRETGLLATPDIRFNIGSVAKVVATLAVMILRDRGQLALDQPVVELLPAFSMRSPAFTQITVRHLLFHASGMPGTNYRNAINFAPMPDYAQQTLQALAQSRLKHEPGELSVYCNDGFTLVELLVPALTGLSFAAFVQREIFGPLGMDLSGYALTYAPEGSFVHPYFKGQRMPQEMVACFATGGVLTTPTDMLKLARLILNEGVHEGRRIVSAESVREAGRSQDPRVRINLTPDLHWGLGWDSVQQPGLHAAGLRAWRKGGNTDFFAAEFVVLPEARLAVMIAGCGQDYGAIQLAEGLLLRVAAERRAITAVPAAIASIVPPPISPAPDNTPLLGIYARTTSPVQVLAGSDGSLTLRHWTQAGWAVSQDQLRARTDGHWWSDGKSTNCFRFQTVDGHHYLVERKLSANKLYWTDNPVGERLAPLAQPLPPAWKARLGSAWRCTNDSPDSLTSRLYPVFGSIGELAELPGYILWNNEQMLRVVDDQEATMAVKVPLYGGRDLIELRMVPVNGREEAHSGSQVFQETPTS
ncbi:serine hydrolase domain-containing protein [Variovorax sp. M-6]|uniref:serine hydrolase domain-containing protein n=1 Tax=Variovorax sp. M-6 TaxID=3233041 RepID=UPI003F9E8090